MCTRRNEGCGFVNIEGFNEEGVIAARTVCHLPSKINITPEELAKMKARYGICTKYTRAPLPQSGGGIVVGTTDGAVNGGTTDGITEWGPIIVDEADSFGIGSGSSVQ